MWREAAVAMGVTGAGETSAGGGHGEVFTPWSLVQPSRLIFFF